VLLISHRFSSVRTADRILVLHDGRLVEAARTTSSSPPAAATPSCSTCRRRPTASSGPGVRSVTPAAGAEYGTGPEVLWCHERVRG
jgi:ABC-type glutathione transport system ATPase component